MLRTASPLPLLLLPLLLLLLLAAPVLAQDELVVGTKESPPFAMKDADGNWTGISIELLDEIARANGWRLRYEERPLVALFTGLADGSLDAAAAALSITSEREEKYDFSFSYYEAGLGIAVAGRERSGLQALLSSIFSVTFLKALTALAVVLSGVGVLVWLLERRKNREQFGGSAGRGIGAGFWWSAVTMTTVGYGDKAPATVGGRAVGLVWMFASIILISSFTAAIASSLTVSRLEAPLTGPEGLPAVRVGTIPGSTSQGWLDEHRVPFRGYGTLDLALADLAAGEIDAVVYDAPLLRWHVRQSFPDRLSVLPARFAIQPYGIALPSGSPRREALNRGLLAKRESAWWDDLLYRYLGK